jgi:hypothetical protein
MECQWCGKAGAEWQAEESEFYYCDQECWVAWYLEQMFLVNDVLRFR